MILVAVFLLSLSSLAFEILLARIFSISQWNHLSFMVISIALFGFGASGTFLSLLDARIVGWEKRLTASLPIKIITLLYTVFTLTSFCMLNLIPLDYLRLPVEPVQMLYLFIVYALLATPFFFSGALVSLAYAHLPDKTGHIYLSSMMGSATGAFMPLLLIPLMGEEKLVLLVAVIPLWIILQKDPQSKRTTASPVISVAAAVLVGTAFSFSAYNTPLTDRLLEIRPSSYKGRSHVLQFPDSRITETTSGLRGRIDRVESPHLHFAPGLSLKYRGSFPGQSAVYKDGDDRLILYDLLPVQPGQSKDGVDDGHFAQFTLSYAGYMLSPDPDSVLVIQRGGGIAIPCARSAGAGEIVVLEENPRVAEIIGSHYGLSVNNRHPRAYLAISQTRFDIIHVESWGSSLPGSAALSQDYLFTIEAITAYMNHLKEEGILIISRRLHLPPSDMLRLWGAANESLVAIGVSDPADHIRILRNWDTFTMIVSVVPIRDEKALQEFAADMNFDWVYARSMEGKGTNQYNVFDAPIYAQEIKGISEAYGAGGQDRYFSDYILDASPQSDRRPFPNRFLKWSRLGDLYRTTGSRFYTLFMSGEVVVSLVFVEALILSVLLLAAPLFLTSASRRKPLARRMIYFLSVGAGFMFTELYFVKVFVLLFGDPIISLTVVLSGILVFSGIGGFVSQWVRIRFLRYVVCGLALLLLLFLIGMEEAIYAILSLPVGYHYLAALLLLLPPGILIGLPFTLGMQHLLQHPVERTYAWAANGCTSVLASIASAQIALSLGIPYIILGALCAYGLAFLSAGSGKGETVSSGS